MEKLQKQFEKAAQNIQLTEVERADMRDRLVEYMAYKPIRGVSGVSTKTKATQSLFPFFRAHHFSGAFLIAVIITTSSFGVSYAADDALPGDFLYNVKVNINEEIKSALLSSDESRITWERERAERRLVEASQLAAEGRLDTEKQEQVSKLFAEHTESMVEQVLAVEETDPVFAAEMSSVFEDSLNAHEAVLARLIVEQEEGKTEEGGTAARGLVEQVRTASMEVEKIRNEAEEKIAIEDESEEVEPAQEGSEQEQTDVAVGVDEGNLDSANLRVRAAYRAQERAQELFARAQELQALLAPESELALQAQAQITFGEELMKVGAQALTDNHLGDAYSNYRNASASFQKVVQLLEVANLFSVEIYPDIEPVVAEVDEGVKKSENSNEIGEKELLEQIQALRTQTEEEISTARKLLLTQEGHAIDVAEKANSRIKDASAHLLRGEIAMVMNDYDDAKALFEQAHKLSSETVVLLQRVGEQEDVNNVEVPTPTPEEQEEETTLKVQHTFKEGVHTYRGEVEVPNPCQELEYQTLVAESFPEQIHIAISTHTPDADKVCAQVVSATPFLVEVQASEGAKLMGVTVNGVAYVFALEESVAQGEEDTQVQEKKQQGFFERAIESTHDLLSPNS